MRRLIYSDIRISQVIARSAINDRLLLVCELCCILSSIICVVFKSLIKMICSSSERRSVELASEVRLWFVLTKYNCGNNRVCGCMIPNALKLKLEMVIATKSLENRLHAGGFLDISMLSRVTLPFSNPHFKRCLHALNDCWISDQHYWIVVL